jgi:hypothetical protein
MVSLEQHRTEDHDQICLEMGIISVTLDSTNIRATHMR